MKEKIEINKPKKEDLDDIKMVLAQWTDKKEVDKYIERIGKEIIGRTEYNMQFWVVRNDRKLVGVIGLSDPLPKVLFLTRTKKPAEIKILYIENNYRGKNMGERLVKFIEDEAKKQGFSGLLVRSAIRYRKTAYGFYKKLGYSSIGKINGGKKNKTMKVFEKVLA